MALSRSMIFVVAPAYLYLHLYANASVYAEKSLAPLSNRSRNLAAYET